MLVGRKILLIVGGGIAAYKSLELIRLFQKSGASVTPVLTKAAEQFITPLSASALSGQKSYGDLFDLTDEAEMGHIELSRSADLLVVAPATADLMSKMAHGIANDLASTLLLATDTPVMIAPAMNVRMWEHEATKRNLVQLERDGIHLCGPNEGEMACGEFGFGRMSEPQEIVDFASDVLTNGPLKGKRILITSGPTHEAIDPVRYIANRSSGAQGSALANACVALGASVTFISGPARAELPQGCKVIQVETAKEMLSAAEENLPSDVAIFAAAVADWRVDSESQQKIKKTKNGLPTLNFVENPDLLATISQMESNRPYLVIGFAAETENILENARSKLSRKRCDWIVANDVSPQTGIMGGTENQVTIVSKDGNVKWPRASKDQVAKRIAEKIVEYFGE